MCSGRPAANIVGTILFLHLPKTAGTSLIKLLQNALTPFVEIYTADDFQQLLAMKKGSRTALRLAYGHMPYGLHDFIEQPCKYCVFLRDPIDRILSAYYYIKMTPAHPVYEYIRDGMTLVEFLNQGENDNGQTRRLGRYNFADISDPARQRDYWWTGITNGRMNENHLNNAKRTLDACSFIGFTEEFSEDVTAMFCQLGLSVPAIIPTENRTSGRPRMSDVDPEIISAIRARNVLDFALYEYARKIRRRSSDNLT